MEKGFIIKDEFLVEVDGNEIMSFSNFKKFIYKNILESAVCWNFCDDNSCAIRYKDRLGRDKDIYVSFSNPNIVTDNGQKFNCDYNDISREFNEILVAIDGNAGNFDKLTDEEKKWYLNFLKKNKPRINRKNIFRDIDIEGCALIFLVFLFSGTFGLALFDIIKYLPIFLVVDLLLSSQFFLLKKEYCEFMRVINQRKINKQRINYLSQELALGKANEYITEKEENFDKRGNFNDVVLEEIYVLLDEVSAVNGKDREVIINKIKLILNDYLKGLEKLKENEASFGYDERCLYLKSEIFKKVAKLRTEMFLMQESIEKEKCLNNEIDIIEEKIERLSSKKEVKVRRKINE